MKKKLIILLSVLALLACSPVFASQKNYRQSSEEVQTLLTLSRLSGTALLEMTYPVTEDTLVFLLSKIDVSRLEGPALGLYENLKDSLENRKNLIETDSVGIDFKLPILIGEAWKGDSFLPFKDRLPLAALCVELDITDHFTLEAVFDSKSDPDVYTDLDGIRLHTLYNIKSGVSHEHPSRAYGSLGNRVFNLTIGRDRVSAGGGITGNLQISENLLFQDYAKFSAMKGPVSYDFTILAYDNPISEAEIKRHNFNDPFKASYMHRLSAVIRNKVNVTLFQGLMTYGKHIFSDPRVLNPFMMIHNTFAYLNGNANNFAGLEVSAALPFGLKIDAQGYIDQIQLSSESSDSGKNAFGVLANLSGSWAVGEGILSGYVEGVYNNEPFYLIESSNSEIPNLEEYFRLDLVSAYSYFKGSEQNYIGYPYGGDIKVLALGASYLWKDMKFSADAMYRIKGGHGIGINEERRADISTSVPEEKSLSVSAGICGKIFEAVSYRAKLGYTNISDYQHINGKDVKEIQFALAFTVDPLSLIKK